MGAAERWKVPTMKYKHQDIDEVAEVTSHRVQ
jgi:hypothetical protein